MKYLPASPDISHLKKQARHLLRGAQNYDVASLQRFIDHLPAVHGLPLASMSGYELHLHDAHSVLAREYGFKSWAELARYVQWKRTNSALRLQQWYRFVYEGEPRERRIAARLAREEPALFAGDPWAACAIGDVPAVRSAIEDDSAWIHASGGAMRMPPLIAVTHSGLLRDSSFEKNLLASAQLLLDHGANPDTQWTSPAYPDSPLSALYGAVGRNHNMAMAELLLSAGATPNDHESLYHSCEAEDSATTRLLLRLGAQVVKTNALGRILDFDKLDDLKLMLRHGGDANEGAWLHHAVLRGRSLQHVQALLDAGADPRRLDHGMSFYRWAQVFGRTDVVAVLQDLGLREELSSEELFLAACARGDKAAAEQLRQAHPNILLRLSPQSLELMPILAGLNRMDAVRTMLELGWPTEVKSGWGATALNHAVYRGNARMAELLLQHGADWTTMHGFNHNVVGTLRFASQAEVMEPPADRDFVRCAKVLLDHGVPIPAEDDLAFSDEVEEFFASRRDQDR